MTEQAQSARHEAQSEAAVPPFTRCVCGANLSGKPLGRQAYRWYDAVAKRARYACSPTCALVSP